MKKLHRLAKSLPKRILAGTLDKTGCSLPQSVDHFFKRSLFTELMTLSQIHRARFTELNNAVVADSSAHH